MLLFSDSLSVACVFQAEERQHHPVQQKEGEVQEGRILLEEKEGWKNDERGPHEAEGPGHGGLW